MLRRKFLSSMAAVAATAQESAPGKLVVLTFDDAVKSHATFVAPLLKELGFNATFFVTHRWMEDTKNFMNWEDIGRLHADGFEIGNHSWTHADFSSPRDAARLAGELALVENELKKVGVPRPVSFAYSGNSFGPEAVEKLELCGYRLARRGGMPEAPYGQMTPGSVFDPRRHHRLLIPTTGDAYPNWNPEYFAKVVSLGGSNGIVVLQFHGVPDIAHPWVHTPPERFREYMLHLKHNGFRTLALRDLQQFITTGADNDALLRQRNPRRTVTDLKLPIEMQATREKIDYWLGNMLVHHGYTIREAATVCGLPEAEVLARRDHIRASGEHPRVLPYPGGRHTRIGFLEGAIDPLRGTKASVFPPDDPRSYVVVDLPEAIFSGPDLLYLAHTHVPTVWNSKNVIIENRDWNLEPDGSLSSRWELPNRIVFGSTVKPQERGAEMTLWLQNGTSEPLRNLRAQVCVLLKAAAGFDAQMQDNKSFTKPVAAARSKAGNHRIVTQWEPCHRAWGNALCPCIHSDPSLPDCEPGQTVRAKGRLWFESA